MSKQKLQRYEKLQRLQDKIHSLEARNARASQKYWATMKTNMALLKRSDLVDALTIGDVKSELADILDLGILNYPQTLRELEITPEMSFKERKAILGLRIKGKEHDKDETRFLEDMAYKADQGRKSTWSWRIAQEAVEKQELGWHPFFVTLTVDPMKTVPKLLWQNGREFRKFIRKLCNVVCSELGHPMSHKPPYRPESDYVTYAGVIEHGASREHHHAHFIIWMREIPSEWKQCPNRMIRNTAARIQNECKPMRRFWPWSLPGLSKFNYFRSIGDIWEREYCFVLPLKNGQPMKVATPRVAGIYITKYLTKEHKEWHHRMKCTRNLGMIKVKNLISQMTLEQAVAMSWRARTADLNLSLMKIHSAPLGLIRSLAKQKVFLEKYRSNRLDLTELITNSYPTFTRMLSSVRDGARPDRMHSSEFYDWVGQFLPEQTGYCEKKLLRVHWLLAKYFPPDKEKHAHVKIGGNNIGYP